jgi:hypothetical protein
MHKSSSSPRALALIAAAALVCLQALNASSARGGAADVSDAPVLIPVFTNFSYFDHHWIQWLPDHPVSEAIEVQTYARPDGKEFIRVFLTERAPPKRQVYYFNDRETAARWSTGRAQYRDINLKAFGAPGQPHGLTLSLLDEGGAPIEWKMEFGAGDTRSSRAAGLRPSQGHAADTAYIFHYYGASAIAQRATLTVGGRETIYERTASDYQKPGPKTGYTAGSYTPVIRLGTFSCVAARGGLACDQGRTFARVTASNALRTGPFGYGGLNIVEVQLSDRAVSSHTHRFADHAFRIDFSPALPPADSLRGGEVLKYAVSIDRAVGVVTGEIKVARARDRVVLDWGPQAPRRGWLHTQ